MIKVKLSELLGARKLNQTDLAEMAKLDPNTINTLYHETSTMVRFDTLNKICKALDCTIEELLEYVPDEVDS